MMNGKKEKNTVSTRLRFICVIALFSLSACSLEALRKPELPVALPGHWSSACSDAACDLSGAWWTDFDDRLLDRFIAEAMMGNPGLLEAEARVRRAMALAEIAGADLEPHLSVGLDANRSRMLFEDQDTIKYTDKVSSYGASLNLTWEADLWGRVRAAEAAALYDLAAEQAVYDGAHLSLAAQIAKAYFAAQEAKGQVRLAAADLKDATDLALLIQERYQRGLRPLLDLKLAETEVDRAGAELTAWERAFDSLLRGLETLMGRYPDASIAHELEGVLPPVPEPVPVGVPAGILSRRPDLAAAESLIMANASRKDSARRDLYPRVALTASAGLVSDHLRDIARGDFGVWSLAGNLMFPLFQGGRLDATVDLREAEEEQARAAFVQSALGAFREVETALASEEKLLERHLHLQDYARDAETALDLSEQRYRSGLLDVLGVLVARRRMFTSRSDCLIAKREALANRVDLYVALGGGFEFERPYADDSSWPAVSVKARSMDRRADSHE